MQDVVLELNVCITQAQSRFLLIPSFMAFRCVLQSVVCYSVSSTCLIKVPETQIKRRNSRVELNQTRPTPCS